MRAALPLMLVACLLAGCGLVLGYDEVSFSVGGAHGGRAGAAGGQSGVCVPQTCLQIGAVCGKTPDGCGNVLPCGTCSTGTFCGGAGPNKCGPEPCTPTTCEAVGAECGLISDGCSDVLDCGSCKSPEVCGGSGNPNQCAATGSGGNGGSAAGAGGSTGGTSSGGSPPSGPCAGLDNGWYCGASSQHPAGNANTRYLCKNESETSQESCPNGCQTMPSGQDDVCKSGTGPCSGLANGWYCGASSQHPAGNANTRYLCMSESETSQESCPNGCQTMPSGQDDVCKSSTGPCSGLANGWYCGASSQHPAGNANTRYLCMSESETSQESCPNGCQTMPSGQDDVCKTGSDGCSGLSDGWYCGGSSQHPAGSSSTRYLCQGGTTADSQVCANGCQVMPPGNDDVCKS